MMENKDFVWVEKYRPKKVENCILPKSIKNDFLQFVEQKSFPNLLLSGSAGTGKTTLARALLEELDYEYLFLNASKDRNIDTIRTTITNFCASMSLTGQKKAVILDEADGLTTASQDSLRGVIEEFRSIRFIFTCNFKNKIIPAIISRTSVVDFIITNEEKKTLMVQLVKRIANILEQENVEADMKIVGNVIKKHFPDNRRILNELQRYSISGKINEETVNFNDTTNVSKLVDCLKTKDFGAMRQWVADNSDMDVAAIFRELYDKLYTEILPESVPQLVILIAEYDYRNAFVSNREINTTALLASIMGSIKFK